MFTSRFSLIRLCQQKGDAARTDIARNRAVSKKVTQLGQTLGLEKPSRQQKRERRGAERLRKTERNFRVFR